MVGTVILIERESSPVRRITTSNTRTKSGQIESRSHPERHCSEPVDRRANTELRKRIDEMTPEEMRKILKQAM